MSASNILIELSGDATLMSKAAEVPQSQLVTKMSDGHILELSCPHPQPTSRCADRPARSLEGAVNHIAKSVVTGCSPPLLHVTQEERKHEEKKRP